MPPCFVFSWPCDREKGVWIFRLKPTVRLLESYTISSRQNPQPSLAKPQGVWALSRLRLWEVSVHSGTGGQFAAWQSSRRGSCKGWECWGRFGDTQTWASAEALRGSYLQRAKTRHQTDVNTKGDSKVEAGVPWAKAESHHSLANSLVRERKWLENAGLGTG